MNTIFLQWQKKINITKWTCKNLNSCVKAAMTICSVYKARYWLNFCYDIYQWNIKLLDSDLHLGIISLYIGLLKTILIENIFQKKQLLKVWHYALKIWILSTPTEFFLSFAPILCWTWADAFWLHTDHSYTPASFYLFRLEKENKVFQLY